MTMVPDPRRLFRLRSPLTPLLLLLLCSSLLTACDGSPRMLALPFDGMGGRGVNSPYAEQQPSLSGRWLAYVSDRRDGQQLYLFDREARQPVPLPNLNQIGQLIEHPSVSEDGRWIAYLASRDNRRAIWLYDRQAQFSRNLSESLGTDVRNPSISADGRRIAFEAAIAGQWDVVVWNRDGGLVPLPR
jgi:Tol biopolymer transport system component